VTSSPDLCEKEVLNLAVFIDFYGLLQKNVRVCSVLRTTSEIPNTEIKKKDQDHRNSNHSIRCLWAC
jgi:hypothetical protein